MNQTCCQPGAARGHALKKTSKEAVDVYRYAIHGTGLFFKQNFDADGMVIEYTCTVIHSVLTSRSFMMGRVLGATCSL